MNLPMKRRLMWAVVCSAALLTTPSFAQPDSYPTKPITIVIAYPPGGSTDLTGRVVANALAKSLNATVVVENVGGAGGAIGAQRVLNAAPDGYTLLVGANNEVAINRLVSSNVKYHWQDFTPIGLIQTTPTVIVVNPKLGVRTPAELLQLVRSKPGGITFGTPGVGTLPHLIGELLNMQAGLNMIHVPYKGGAPALNDLLAGVVDMAIMTPLIRDTVQSGKLVAIGTTALKRTSSTPDWPTLAETVVPGFEALAWFGLMARSNTPPDILRKLSAAMQEALQDPVVRQKIAASGDVPLGTTQEFQDFLNREHDRWERTVKQAAIKPE